MAHSALAGLIFRIWFLCVFCTLSQPLLHLQPCSEPPDMYEVSVHSRAEQLDLQGRKNDKLSNVFELLHGMRRVTAPESLQEQGADVTA